MYAHPTHQRFMTTELDQAHYLGAPPLAPMPRELEAKRLGLNLPKKPTGKLTPGGSLVWDVLVDIDILNARLARIYEREVQMLAAFGAARCASVQSYNRQAIALYHLQGSVLRRLKAAGIDGLPDAPAWPPLFVSFGVTRGRGGYTDISCPPDGIVRFASDESQGIRAVLKAPDVCPEPPTMQGATGLGLAPALAWGLGSLLSLGALTGGVWVLSNKLSEDWGDAGATRRDTEQGRLQAEIDDAYSQKLLDCSAFCMQNTPGAVGADCLAKCDETLPDPVDILEASRKRRAGERGVLWWLGAGAALLLVTGVGFKIWQAQKD